MAIVAILSTPVLTNNASAADRFTVVLDAGHGGKDPGAVGKKTREKDINLGIVLKLGDLIKRKNPDVKVIYTRNTDVFVELVERARIANRNHADLFISVHTNAAKSKSAYGTETYALGLARTEENLQVAKRENSVILLEDDYNTKYEGFDPTSTESYIMFEFMQGTNLEQSVNLASLIQNQFEGNAGRTDRGVRQAGFWVLRATGMPSILIEVGYISNPDEEHYLSTESGREKIAESIYNAFCDYKSDWIRKQNGKVKSAPESAKYDKPAVKETVPENTDVTPYRKEQKKDKQKQEVVKSTVTQPERTVCPETVTDQTANTVGTEKTKSDVYKIQLMATPKVLDTKSSYFKGVSPVNYYRENGFYKYTYGDYNSKEEAEKGLSRIKQMFKDAFIVHFVNGTKVNY